MCSHVFVMRAYSPEASGVSGRIGGRRNGSDAGDRFWSYGRCEVRLRWILNDGGGRKGAAMKTKGWHEGSKC